MKYITLALGQLQEIVPGSSILLYAIFATKLKALSED